ncbi:LysR family transcriptional regulator [Pelagibius sp. Alg239-R121]|uniref:LysR family transcriptional regulator n=1 Tax=Pelagibius sp. Alg239-R121 TaxID=2993448 RepID=UPI0024A664B0|nr:LysR family transcriptional regulator [Pelagibius sp. Alg239-R121]
MRKLPIAGLEVFLAVAEHGSLRAAATAIGVRPPVVSHHLKAFEEQIGVGLYARTTRSVQLTDAGRALLKKAAPAMMHLHEALEDARGVGGAKKGNLRLTLPYGAYRLSIAPKLAAFQQAYPEIQLDLSFNEAFVDIIAERFHAGVRLGGSINEDMIAVRLTPPLKGAYFSAPAYFEKHGRPEQPQDLLNHNCIRYRYINSKRLYDWCFVGPDGEYTVDVSGGLIVNSFEAIMNAARDGLGIGQNFRAEVLEELEAGGLESVLDAYVTERPGFYLYFPRENARLELLRIFIDFMKL